MVLMFFGIPNCNEPPSYLHDISTIYLSYISTTISHGSPDILPLSTPCFSGWQIDKGEEGESSCEGDGFSIVISMRVKQS